ncbi:TspO_MBR domain-containing protein [Cephalotus follicularis]|uniref:TspO_MBR domain-containing protein n=1 Tax=Cephalotus follicularis TaxID=3775 RepID=A0A1Q3C4A2_CEPFO|nr:TspO_MBR domain-containing protein [Cephalotus follicularis]
MASQILRERFNNHNTTTPTNPTTKAKPKTKQAEAKRALRSLAISIVVPLSITLVVIFLFGSGQRYHALSKPFWFPPLWLIHLASLSTSFFMSLAAWLVWADGGFGMQSDALPLYIAHVSLSLVWDPLVLVIGAAWIGLFFTLVHFGTLFACYRSFKRFNPISKDLVKPCMAWMAFLSIVTFKLIYL